MKSLVTKHPWPLPLLLLLLLPLKPHGDYWDADEYDGDSEFRDYMRELYSTRPTKPPTVERMLEKIIANPDRPFYDGDDYCSSEIMFKNIHYKFRCYPEHYFVKVPAFWLTAVCMGEQVKCNNGAQFCRRSKGLMRAVRCTLERGDFMGSCVYESIFVTGYPVVACQWDNETKSFIPNDVLEVLPAK